MMQAATSMMTRIICLLFFCRQIAAELITTPKDAEAIIGTVTFFNCSSTLPLSKIHWYHYEIGTEQNRQIVYGFGQFYGQYQHGFRIELNETERKSNLVIEQVSANYAGKFECQDDMGRGSSGYAQLVVLETIPVCGWKIENQQITGSSGEQSTKDRAYLSCSFKFRGNKLPEMIWKRSGSNEVLSKEVAHINVSADRTTYSHNIEVTHDFDGKSFQCETTNSATTQFFCIAEPSSGKFWPIVVGVIVAIVAALIIIAAIILYMYIKRRGVFKPNQSIVRHSMNDAGDQGVAQSIEKRSLLDADNELGNRPNLDGAEAENEDDRISRDIDEPLNRSTRSSDHEGGYSQISAPDSSEILEEGQARFDDEENNAGSTKKTLSDEVPSISDRSTEALVGLPESERLHGEKEKKGMEEEEEETSYEQKEESNEEQTEKRALSPTVLELRDKYEQITKGTPGPDAEKRQPQGVKSPDKENEV